LWSYFKNSGNWIDTFDYSNGFSIYGFDLCDDYAVNEGPISMPKTGSLKLKLNFAKALENPITIVLYSVFDNVISIDADRNISTDFFFVEHHVEWN
jgi:hypothetical protein